MKKIVLSLLAGLLLTACSDEKKQFEQAVLAQMQVDQDIKDYNIDSERMAQCVIDRTSKNMPGLFSWDPRRGPYYIGYSKLISVKQSGDPKKSFQEIQEIFGSKKEAMRALLNYSESVMECVNALVSQSEAAQG